MGVGFGVAQQDETSHHSFGPIARGGAEQGAPSGFEEKRAAPALRTPVRIKSLCPDHSESFATRRAHMRGAVRQ
jgi:hypothetical protein